MNSSHDDDVILRAFGFRIHARPKEGPALWKRGNKTCSYTEALEESRRLLACRIEDLNQESPCEGTMTDLQMATAEEIVAELKMRFPGVVVALRAETEKARSPYNMLWMHFVSESDKDELALALGRWAAGYLEDRKDKL